MENTLFFMLAVLPPQGASVSCIVVMYVTLTADLSLWVAFNVNHNISLSIRVIVCLSLPPVAVYYAYSLST